MTPIQSTGVTPARYSAVAIALHWLIALLLIGNIGLAWYFNTLTGLAKVGPTQLHKSIGITVLILSVLRVAWRLAVKPPPLPAETPRWERLAAGAVHTLFYVVMLGLPLTGWFMVSASPLIHAFPIKLYGLVEWPAIGPLTTLPHDQMHATHEAFERAHGLLGKLAYVLIVLHVGAALGHQFVRRDATLSRMIPAAGRG